MAKYNYIVILLAFLVNYSCSTDIGTRWEPTLQRWFRDQPVNQTIGPDDAIYCRVEDPSGVPIFDGFGVCQIVIHRVSNIHFGAWKLIVGRPNRILTEEYNFLVEVTNAASKPVVDAALINDRPILYLTCTVVTQERVNSCKYRDPHGKIIISNEDVTEDRYKFDPIKYQQTSNGMSSECLLEITTIDRSDIGIWRCAMETTEDVYYGYLTIFSRTFMQDPDFAATVVLEPLLAAVRPTVTAVEGEPVTLSCAVASSIQYCYFRNRFGSVFVPSRPTPPTDQQPHHATYFGAGLDAGDCGVRFHSLPAPFTGEWTCHVGFDNSSMPEQRAVISVTIEEPVSITQEDVGDTLHIDAVAQGQRTVEYCRFVRIDGLGFKTTNVPEPYISVSNLASGSCGIRIRNADVLEHHPWSVAMKIVGQDEEVIGSSEHSIPPGTDGGHGNGTPPPDSVVVIQYRNHATLVILSLATVLFSILLLGALLFPKKNREWTSLKVAQLGDSMRNTFSRDKNPLPA